MTTILIAAGTVLALIYQLRGTTQHAPDTAATIAKTGATTMLVIAGLVGGAPLAVVLGLALGALGDFFLTRRDDNALLAGIGLFALGHLAYTFWMFTPESAGRMVWALPIFLLALSTERWLLPHAGELAGSVRAYVWIIALMASAAMTLPAAAWPAMLGAVLFVISDALLGLWLFVAETRPTRRRLALAIWPAYWGGQALILLGALNAA